jgi:SAM-dependent methyltransferase
MTVSAEAVTWAYRFFLGRDPESEAVIATHLDAKDELQLARRMMRSQEFAARRRQHFAMLPTAESVEPAELEIDCDGTPADIAACLEKIKATWSHLGVLKPHFSVLTDKKFLPGNLAGSIEEFWSSGDTAAERVLGTLARHGFTPSGKTCVEYGCGVGRVTMALARSFARVDAYDISAGHLELARERARELGIGNVRLHECAANILADLEPCDAFHSRIVFQHNPPPVITQLIRKALAALRPGGFALFQVPSYMSGYRFRLREWLAADHPLAMQMHCLPQAKIFEVVAEERCVVLEVREDDAAGARDSIVSNTFVVRKESAGAPRG